ncbi:CDP-diacylglycerol--glycerol-3-phosphate 3-phosphatidyltransferase [Thermodesulfobacterium hydrogeniphilum]|uniref:CDP-diacylglycerol--glycerol-3-phosphate 3-phosphatidyltransferase n=1 Tax=Thermodesulfobacterium hydrogeniphilum TaxID=161156 RepID=UPI0006896570|nr:CDP-diacylglycerol--glycerol-3-phosphate 3-phosphatidyltransferase [Thermodesulfobacterium hydrogeniphilum]
MTEKISPNFLTLLRILFLPFPCALLFLNSLSAKIIALFILSSLALTDYLDGILARKYKKVSSLGTILDPVADKIFVVSIYLTLVYLKYFAFWPVFFIILREILISYLRAWFPEETKVQKIAKLKTLLQMSLAILVIIFDIFFQKTFYFINYFLWFVAIFSYLSAFNYFYKVFKTIKKFKTNLGYFFESLYSLGYAVSLILIFPLAGNLFWINIIALCFFFFRKGLAKSSPKWAHKKSLIHLLIILGLILEFYFFKKLYFSLWSVLVFSFVTDGIRSLKLAWKILRFQ